MSIKAVGEILVSEFEVVCYNGKGRNTMMKIGVLY